MKLRITYLLLIIITAISCKEDIKTKLTDGFHEEYYKVLQEQLITAKEGATISIPEGEYHFSRPLSLDGISGVTIAGAGMRKTILSFKGQKAGAEGIKVTADNVTIKDLTVQDTKGDCIKLQDCKGIQITNVNTTWTGGALETNGGYGLYPVSSTDVTIDGCEASYASDAGIYVGQSRNVVVKNCYAHHNVAGIEIENCIGSDVYDNKAENNTGGILVFDLPDLPLGNGHSAKVHDNIVKNNNHRNFAPEGNIVATVPPGTGFLLLAAKKVELYDNVISGHKTTGMGVVSYPITQRPFDPEQYDPFSYDVAIYNNTFTKSNDGVDTSTPLGQMMKQVFSNTARDIIYDGILSPMRGTGSNSMGICIGDNGGADFANLDAANSFQNVSTDATQYACAESDRVKVAL